MKSSTVSFISGPTLILLGDTSYRLHQILKGSIDQNYERIRSKHQLLKYPTVPSIQAQVPEHSLRGHVLVTSSPLQQM